VIGSKLANQISFSVSHSHELALYAVTKRSSIGVDVEYTELLRMFSLSRARSSVNVRPHHYQHPQVRSRRPPFTVSGLEKRPYLKACGVGLGADPTKLEVPDHASAHWQILTFYPRASFTAALALSAGD
jgi:phosphopantetheinyl transferase